jgi:hypothetical protein
LQQRSWIQKTGCLFLFLFSLAPTVLAQNLIPNWDQTFGDVTRQRTYSQAVDPSGNVYITGSFYGDLDFGGEILEHYAYGDVFIAKFNSAGIHLWSQRFGDSGSQYGWCLDLDDSGNVYLAGTFEDEIDFGCGLHVCSGDSDLFMVKFDSLGQCQWSTSFEKNGNFTWANISAGQPGCIYATGWFYDYINFGGNDLNCAGEADIFIAKFNANDGSHLQSDRFGDASDQTGDCVVANSQGEFVLACSGTGSVNIWNQSFYSTNLCDVFLVKCDSYGNVQWGHMFGDLYDDFAHDVAFDMRDQSIILSGSVSGSINLGGELLHSHGALDPFLAKFDQAGTHQWSQSFGGPDYVFPRTLAVSEEGDIAIGGDFKGTADLGGGELVSEDDYDVFIATYTADGMHQASLGAGGVGRESCAGVGYDSHGGLYVAGYYRTAIDFGLGPLISRGNDDLYLCRFHTDLADVTEQSFESDLRLSVTPNPGNGPATLEYSLSTPGHVRLSIHDAEGRLLERLVDQVMPAGDFRLRLTPSGRESGMRYAQLVCGDQVVVTSILHVR